MPAGKLRMTAQQREFRRLRIMGMVQAGYSYLAIADAERLSKERVRQIVVASLKVKDEGTKGDLALAKICADWPEAPHHAQIVVLLVSAGTCTQT